jgi:hypothetical protein
MTLQGPISYMPGAADAGRELAQLRHVLGLVRQIAGLEVADVENALDESVRLSSAYEGALPVVQKRFDTLSGETAAWAAVAVEALLEAERAALPAAAAAALADELSDALRQLAGIVSAEARPFEPPARLPSWLAPAE